MESTQVVCSSPPFCKLEPESPPSWDSVDFTESTFGGYLPDEWEDDKDNVGIKNFPASDLFLDLDTLMKEEPFSWIDERSDGLYTPFDWSPNDIKVFNGSGISTSPTIEQKPFGGMTPTSITVTTTSLQGNNNVTINNSVLSSGGKMYHQNSNNHHHSVVAAAAVAAVATPDLLREFEDVLINTTTDSLTPPESPRDQATSLITLLQEMEPCTTSSASNDIDAIVATQAENMVPHNLQHLQPHQYMQQQLSPSSPDPWSSPSMGSNSSSSSSSDSGYDDPDWSPSPLPLQSSMTNENNSSTGSSSSSSSSSSRRKRAAATTTEERKLRKKEQNKNAATRYRQKKKQEIEVIIGEEKDLLEKHDQLKAESTEITREIRYLKSLLRDLYKAKGLIS